MIIPNINDISNAYLKIKDKINKTPILTSHSINEIAGAEIYFKCENFQKVGAFKFRGATYSLEQLSNDELEFGVATHSSGNHAQALALAARNKNIPAYIVMPSNSPLVKSNAVKGYGADVIFCEPTLEARESTLKDVVSKTNAKFIHPFKHFEVIAGQGTVALEIFQNLNNLVFIITPVGGGGLLSGTSIATKGLSPNTKVIGAEPEGANDTFRSFYGNELFPSINPKTICDGLLTSLGEINYEIIKNNVGDIFTANDEEIIFAMKLIWERMKIIIEPSSAVALAVVLKNKEYFQGSKIAIIISGGNVDLDNLPW